MRDPDRLAVGWVCITRAAAISAPSCFLSFGCSVVAMDPNQIEENPVTY